jgi:hypothetical protein
LPTKKSTKKAEPSPEDSGEGPINSSECCAGMGTNLKDMMSKETQVHILRGFSELAMAMEGMIPKTQMPEDAKQHAQAAKREVLLMLRSLIDAKLGSTATRSETEPKLKKIEVE